MPPKGPKVVTRRQKLKVKHDHRLLSVLLPELADMPEEGFDADDANRMVGLLVTRLTAIHGHAAREFFSENVEIDDIDVQPLVEDKATQLNLEDLGLTEEQFQQIMEYGESRAANAEAETEPDNENLLGRELCTQGSTVPENPTALQPAIDEFEENPKPIDLPPTTPQTAQTPVSLTSKHSKRPLYCRACSYKALPDSVDIRVDLASKGSQKVQGEVEEPRPKPERQLFHPRLHEGYALYDGPVDKWYGTPTC